MTPPRGTCEFCGSEVTRLQQAAWPVSGWEIERDAGGANHIAGKQRLPNRIAHARCLESHLRRGGHEQLTMGAA